MIENVLIRIGDFRFSVTTAAYEQFARSQQYRWEAQNRLWNGQALQFTGLGDQTITLIGAVYPQYAGGARQIEALRELAAKRKPVPGVSGGFMWQSAPQAVVTGFGDYLGLWVISDIKEDQSAMFPDGAPRCQRFTLTLKHYGEDATQ